MSSTLPVFQNVPRRAEAVRLWRRWHSPHHGGHAAGQDDRVAAFTLKAADVVKGARKCTLL